MGNDTEIELKLQFASPTAWGDFLQDLESFQTGGEKGLVRQTLEACYYDTLKLSLQKAHLAYRIRRENGQWVATVKGGGSSAGGLHKRQEWNIAVPEAVPNIDAFSTCPVGRELKASVGQDELKLLFITRFTRDTLNVEKEGSRIEVAADRGEIIAGQNREPILEIELELKDGRPSSLLKLGAELANKYPLLPEARSKYFRGLQLAGLAEEDKFETKNCQSDNNAGSLITRAITEKAALLRHPDNNEKLVLLREAIQGLILMCETFSADMAEWQYEYFHSGLRQLADTINDQKTDIISSLGRGQYTSLLLNLWAWILEKKPAGK